MKTHRWALRGFLVLNVILLGCLGGVTIGLAAEATNRLSANAPADVLQIGDLIKINLSGLDTKPIEQKIKDDGTISLELITNSIVAAGKTASQLEKDIVAAYVPKFYKHMSAIVVTDSRYFFVYGEVKLSGKYPHVAGLTVTKAIANAGGFTDYARKTEVGITRQDGTVEKVDCKKTGKDPKADKPVNPGDIINVPRRSIFSS